MVLTFLLEPLQFIYLMIDNRGHDRDNDKSLTCDKMASWAKIGLPRRFITLSVIIVFTLVIEILFSVKHGFGLLSPCLVVIKCN